jgi:hypothetical protein
VAWTAAGLYAALLAFFPFGLMTVYLRAAARKFMTGEDRIVGVREGLTETITYVEHRQGGQPWTYRLLTNGFSMSATGFEGKRYMKLFVYLPVALHPAPRRALLISYGLGSTAKALTDTRELERIDVVDISKDVLEMNRVVYPDVAAFPLNDPRVQVHIEDGRYFLQGTREHYDLITAEPPPPKNAGVVNLYTQDYFHLLRSRLAEGGFVSYWLPVHSLELEDTRAIIAGFCSAFSDCSLWHGVDADWILLGSRQAKGKVPEERFRRQWEDPVVGPELRNLGIEAPEHMGALFLADAEELGRIVGGAPPLTDDRPYRLSPYYRERAVLYAELMDATRAARSFSESPWVAATWPPRLAAASRLSFGPQQILYNRYWGNFVPARKPTLDDVHALLTRTSLRTLPLLMLHGDADTNRIVEAQAAAGVSSPWVDEKMTARALSLRDYESAVHHARSAHLRAPHRKDLAFLAAYTLALAGRVGEAQAFLATLPPAAVDEVDGAFLARTFGLALVTPAGKQTP